jgi:hypothetical protein
MRALQLSILALIAQINGRTQPARLSAQPPVPIWTGKGETGPDSSKHDVFLSADGHTLIVLVPNTEGGKTVKQVPLWNDIAPTVNVSVLPLGPGRWRYLYSIGNASSANDPIGTWAIIVPSNQGAVERVVSPQATKRWGGAMSNATIPRQDLLGWNEPTELLRWYYHEEGSQLRPGETLGDFAIDSLLLPGFTTGWFAAGKSVVFDPAWPERVFHQLQLFDDRRWRGDGLVLIGPMFRPATPLATFAANYLVGLRYLIKNGQLDEDGAFASGLVTALEDPEPKRLKERAMAVVPNGTFEEAIHSALALVLRFTAP